MRAAELGAFLRSRRSRLSPADAGFPTGPGDRRRAPGLRREELASRAGVAVSWLARLEQGRAHSVSPEVLAALAGALKLDDVERVHLFALAGFRADRVAPPRVAVTPALRALLDALDPNPAYLLDRAWNIVAWNEAEAALFPGLLRFGESAPNLLELIFGDDDLRRLMVDHDEEQVRLVAQFRVHRTDWPDEPELAALVASLLATSAAFTALWAAEDVAPFVTTRRVFDHAVAGRLEFDHHRFAALDQVGTQLVVYTPVPGADSAERLRAVWLASKASGQGVAK
ncbi:MAG TPA: helix-turn-helix transcriptional regulator [Acidimicrobiales bacterium]|nr:helix-turn-helix transcriptional regulator [Acidimicrobiales bacterium]